MTDAQVRPNERKTVISWREPRSWNILILAIALVGGIFLRTINLGEAELHFDEAISVKISQGTLAEVLENNAKWNSAPPLSILLLRSALVFGWHEWSVRIVPALAGVTLIVIMWLILRRASPWVVAIVVALACSPTHVALSREFRVYELGAVVAAAGVLSMLRFHECPTLSRASALGAIMILGFQLQYGLAPLFFAIALALMMARYDCEASRTSVARSLSVIVIAGLVGIVVVYMTSLRAHLYANRGGTYLAGYFTGTLWQQTAQLCVQLLSILSFGSNSLVLAFVAVLGIVAETVRGIRRPLILTFYIALVTHILLALAGLYPFSGNRQNLHLSVFVFLFAGFGLDAIARHCPHEGRAIALTLSAGLVAISLGQSRKIISPSTTGVRDAVRVASDLANRGGRVFVLPGAYPHFLFYASRVPRARWIKAAESDRWMGDERQWIDLVARPPYIDQLDEALRREGGLWVLTSFYLPKEPHFDELAAQRGWNVRPDSARLLYRVESFTDKIEHR